MNNLKKLRKQRGIGQVDISNMLGITQPSYSRYEAGLRDIPNDILMRLSEIFSVSTDEILGIGDEPIGRPIEIQLEPEFTDDVIRVPVVASLRCGFGEPGAFVVREPMELPGAWGRRWGKDLRIIKAVGDSMSPVITPGDQLLCVPGDGWQSGQIVVVTVNDADTVKRIRRAQDGGIDLIPENKAYKAVHYTMGEVYDLHIKVLGRVVKVIGPDL